MVDLIGDGIGRSVDGGFCWCGGGKKPCHLGRKGFLWVYILRLSFQFVWGCVVFSFILEFGAVRLCGLELGTAAEGGGFKIWAFWKGWLG